MSQYVINADKSVEPMDDPVEWMNRYETDDRMVASEQVGEALVVTQFRGIAHGHDGDGRPLVFETIVLKGLLDGHQWQWPTYKAAEEGHIRVVEAVRAAARRQASSPSEPSA
jgi:hypothetical protein